MPETVSFDLAALLQQISARYPDIQLIEGARFAWHSQKRQLAYQSTSKYSTQHIFSLLHELGHAVLDHKDYTYDIELVQLEAAAWEKARELATDYNVELDDEHIQNCLDTYRDWLHLRATCPVCFTRSLQASARQYHCFNCQADWSVTRSRLCRPYRLKTA